MELELGLKITKTVDDFRSTDLRIAKDRAGTLFVSRETEAMFILTVHLKGYKIENIKININEDGTLISISGEKPVQEMVMKGWMLVKKEPEIRGFNKTFKIPNGVNLDGINAKYSDDESEATLTITMPKLNKGLVGERIQELHKEEVADEQTAAADQEAVVDHSESSARKDRKNEAETSNARRDEEIRNGEEVEPWHPGDSEDDDKGGWKRFVPCFFMGSAFILMVVGFVKSKRRRD